MFKKLVLLLFFNFLFLTSYCQKNYISDTSLENIKLYDTKVSIESQIFRVKDTSAFFGITNKIHMPISIHDAIGAFYYSINDEPHSGKVYALIKPIGIHKKTNENETYGFGINLTDTLAKDNVYKIGFYIKPFSGNCLTPNLDIAFSKESVEYYYSRDIISYKSYGRYLELHNKGIESVMKDTAISIIDIPIDTYTFISFDYKALGGEKSIYIGNIRNIHIKKYEKIKPYGRYRKLSQEYFSYNSYYLIDDVSVIDYSIDMSH